MINKDNMSMADTSFPTVLHSLSGKRAQTAPRTCRDSSARLVGENCTGDAVALSPTRGGPVLALPRFSPLPVEPTPPVPAVRVSVPPLCPSTSVHSPSNEPPHSSMVAISGASLARWFATGLTPEYGVAEMGAPDDNCSGQ